MKHQFVEWFSVFGMTPRRTAGRARASRSTAVLLATLLIALPFCMLSQVPPVPPSAAAPKALFAPELYGMGTNFVGSVTNGPAVLDAEEIVRTNASLRYPGLLSHLRTDLTAEQRQEALSMSTQKVFSVYAYTNLVFNHFLPDSLNHLVWTNFIAHTNGRTMRIWSERTFPQGWPEKPPLAKWDHHCLMWGMKGETALSPAWEAQGAPGQIPITLLTRRHGYARGHDMGPDGFHKINAGKRVWFLTKDDVVVVARIAREVVRTMSGSGRDYTMFLFDRDVPEEVETLRVVSPQEFMARYQFVPGAPWVLFETEQLGNVSANVPGFTVPTWKGGDSGSPNLLALPGELGFVAGRSTSGASPEMQADMDELCRQEHLDPSKYQLSWIHL
ncbi:MAG TPA: hypothetical protein VG167_10825 [Verrucomicrobiae bacterium]|nr:hypothetical protein [Verrucomicrobiae bacterium]